MWERAMVDRWLKWECIKSIEASKGGFSCKKEGGVMEQRRKKKKKKRGTC